MQWATVQAEQSRRAADEAARSQQQQESQNHSQKLPQSIPQLSSNNPFASKLPGAQSLDEPGAGAAAAAETTEESTLAIVLAAHSEVADALSAFDAHQQRRVELKELRTVEERSRQEVVFDRSRAGEMDEEGNYNHRQQETEREMRTGRYLAADRGNGEGGSGSRDASRERAVTAAAAVTTSQPSSSPRQHQPNTLNPYAAYLSSNSPLRTNAIEASPPRPAQSPAQAPSHQVPYSDLSGAFVIPDSFDAQRPSVVDAAGAEEDDPFSDIRPREGRSAARNEGGYDYLDYAELHDATPSHLPQSSQNQIQGASSSSSTASQSADSAATAIPQHPTPRRQGTSDSEIIPTPSEPSEKALGKLRRLSVRDDASPSDEPTREQQLRLEAALREKYTKNWEDKEH